MSGLLVDSHCHLDMMDPADYGGDLDSFVATAREADVGHMLCVSVSLATYPTVRAIADRFENVFHSVGVHPNERGEPEVAVDELAELASAPDVVAVGETGLDYFRSTGTLDWQRERFRRHLHAAREVGKPVIVHCRDAAEDTLGILEAEGVDEVGGVMHCFVEDWDVASRAMDLGLHISFSGIVTFKSARVLQDVAARLPAERLLVETDSPYLAPVPFRGKPNQPAYVRHVAEFVARLREESWESVARTTTGNFFKLFAGARPVAA